MKRFIQLLFAFYLTFSMSQSFANEAAAGCEANGINYVEASAFVNTFKAALKADDKEKIADMLDYPVRVNSSSANGKTVSKTIKDKAALIAQYHAIFTQPMKDAIMKDAELFCNDQGASIGNGSIWLRTSDKDGAKIFSIND